MASISSSIQVSGLGRQTMAALISNAKVEGLSVEGYIKNLIKQELSIADLARTHSMDDILAPVRRQFRDSGMSEKDLSLLVDEARDEHRKSITKKKKRS